ncbi:hypothetical protein ACFV4F_38980 [Kitasatospora sp. NPDC059722]|uniref:hypothetical protein n=1 Tax=unclassified Kitasatospora TaxID=2633591 RepID=UPI003656574A
MLAKPAPARALADRLMVVPPKDLNPQAPATGRYSSAIATVAGENRVSHPDLAVALLDQTDAPTHHRVQWAVSHRPTRHGAPGGSVSRSRRG